MRSPSIAIFALVLVTAAAQRPGGGTSHGGLPSGPPTLTNPNPFSPSNWGSPARFGTASIGTGAHRLWRSGSFSSPLILNWNVRSPLDDFGFYNAPDPGYPVGRYWPDYYAQSSNMPAFPPVPIEQQSPTRRETPSEVAESSMADTSGMPVYRGPASPPDTSDEHPPLIALKNHWAYTVLKYWVKGNMFHFITTQGDLMQVSTNMLDRIYPTPTRTPKTEPKPGSVR